MSRSWYVHGKHKIAGPMSTPQLKKLVAEGVVKRETKVRAGTYSEWTTAESINSLFFSENSNRSKPASVEAPPISRSRTLGSSISDLARNYELVLGELRDVEQTWSHHLTQVAEAEDRIQRLSAEQRLLARAAWYQDLVEDDPLWSFLPPVFFLGIFAVLVFCPALLVTGSIAFAACSYLLISIATICGFFGLNATTCSNARLRLASLKKELIAARSQLDSIPQKNDWYQQEVSKLKREQFAIEQRLEIERNKARALQLSKNPRIVYILTNPTMQGLVKIGLTTQGVKARMDQLSTTGVALPYECFYAAYVEDEVATEKYLHKTFSSCRVNSRREFFKISPVTVKQELVKFALGDATKS